MFGMCNRKSRFQLRVSLLTLKYLLPIGGVKMGLHRGIEFMFLKQFYS